jgi:aspartyl-tRNA(Asn)/glutamyl-tRNA(Gln) amidotransferase subunit B
MVSYVLPAYDAGLLTADRELADYFEACAKKSQQPKQVSNWIMGPLLALLNARGIAISESPVSAEHLARLLQLIDTGKISGKIAKTVFDEMAQSGSAPETIVKEKGLVQVSDTSAIEAAVLAVVDSHPQEVAAYANGKTKLIGFFVGQVMKQTRGKANPQLVNRILKETLEK